MTTITATLNDGTHAALPLRWVETRQFVGKIEYESRYPELAEGASSIQELTRFDLVLTVYTKDETFEVRGVYDREKGLRPGEYTWFRKVEQ